MLLSSGVDIDIQMFKYIYIYIYIPANKIRLAERYFYVTITLAGNILLTFFWKVFFTFP